MSVLNLRTVPEELFRQLQALAKLRGEGFHAMCIQMLAEAYARSQATVAPVAPMPAWSAGTVEQHAAFANQLGNLTPMPVVQTEDDEEDIFVGLPPVEGMIEPGEFDVLHLPKPPAGAISQRLLGSSGELIADIPVQPKKNRFEIT